MSQYFEEFSCQCFSTDELRRIHSSGDPFLSAALYFAVKEASLKAIGIGLKEGVAWDDIEVLGLANPIKIRITAESEEHARRLGIQNFLVQIALSRETALASVIASGGI
jgi:holo-[acyl-carrier protein] synthase